MALELESNPISVKYALHLALGLRLPLTSVQPQTAAAIREAMLTLAGNDSNIFNSRQLLPMPGNGGAEYR